MSAVPLRHLGDCATVLPGFSLRGRVEHDPKGTHQVILPRHVREGMPYSYTPADELRVVPGRDAERYHLQAGDVLFLARSTRNIAVRLASIPEPSIVSLVFHLIRCKPEIDPDYLTWHLNQAPAQAAIAQSRVGSGTLLVPRQALSDLAIPLPALGIQRQVAHLAALMGRERQLVEQLLDETRRGHRLLGDAVTQALTTAPSPNPSRTTP